MTTVALLALVGLALTVGSAVSPRVPLWAAVLVLNLIVLLQVWP